MPTSAYLSSNPRDTYQTRSSIYHKDNAADASRLEQTQPQSKHQYKTDLDSPGHFILHTSLPRHARRHLRQDLGAVIAQFSVRGVDVDACGDAIMVSDSQDKRTACARAGNVVSAAWRAWF